MEYWNAGLVEYWVLCKMIFPIMILLNLFIKT